MKALKWILLFIFLLPVAAFAFVKPARILVPQINDVSCPNEKICVEDAKKYVEAKALYAEASKYVQDKLGTFDAAAMVVFCSSQNCFDKFGGGRKAALTIGTFGTVISPRGWQGYYVRHELIHHWQAENLGNVKFWRMPVWLREGMAYSLSGDPRKVLNEPFQSYRDQFERWNRARGQKDLLTAIKELK